MAGQLDDGGPTGGQPDEREAVRFDVHGATSTACASPSRGTAQLCAWMLEIPATTPGTPHEVDREEVLHVLEGELTVTLAGQRATLSVGDAAVLAGDVLQVDNDSDGPARAWVSAAAGIGASLPDGTRLTPPWAR